jgi:hypothetical protein
VQIEYAQLTAAKVSNPKFRGKRGNSPDISKGISQSGMCRFESSEVSQPFLCSAGLPKRRENGPEIRAFRARAFVSRPPICQGEGGNGRKSPAFSANIPVLERLLAETGLITTAARPWLPILPPRLHGNGSRRGRWRLRFNCFRRC